MVIENRPGAGRNTDTGQVAQNANDSHVFVVSTNGPLVYNTVVYSKLSYDPFTELRRPTVYDAAACHDSLGACSTRDASELNLGSPCMRAQFPARLLQSGCSEWRNTLA